MGVRVNVNTFIGSPNDPVNTFIYHLLGPQIHRLEITRASDSSAHKPRGRHPTR